METIITVLLVAGAGIWFVYWLRGRARGTGGCSCGGCGGKCPNKKIEAGEATIERATGK